MIELSVGPFSIHKAGAMVKGDALLDLIKQAQAGDADAMESVLLQFEPLVIKHVNQRRGDPDDLAQAGRMQLWKAILSYDPTRGAAPMTHFYKAVWGSVASASVRNAKKDASCSLQDHLSDDTTLLDIMADPNATSPDEPLQDREAASGVLERISGRLDRLKPRWRDVIERRFGINGHEKMTQKEIGGHFGITCSRVHQIEAKAMVLLLAKYPPSNPKRCRTYEKNTRWAAKMRAAGRCPRCGKPPEEGVLCNLCKAKKRRNKYKHRMVELAAAGPRPAPPPPSECCGAASIRHGFNRHRRQRLRCEECGKTRLAPVNSGAPNVPPNIPIRKEYAQAVAAS